MKIENVKLWWYYVINYDCVAVFVFVESSRVTALAFRRTSFLLDLFKQNQKSSSMFYWVFLDK
jgi:hypothetical protein